MLLNVVVALLMDGMVADKNDQNEDKEVAPTTVANGSNDGCSEEVKQEVRVGQVLTGIAPSTSLAARAWLGAAL